MLRSKAELEDEERAATMRYTLPAALQQKLDRALANYRQGAAGGKKKVKKRPRDVVTTLDSSLGSSGGSLQERSGTSPAPPKPKPPKPILEDIFAGIGKYVPAGVEKEKASTKGTALGGTGKSAYFTGLSKDEDGKESEGASEVEALLKKAAQGKDFAKDGHEATPDLFVDRKKTKEGTALGGGSSYDDYYPDAGRQQQDISRGDRAKVLVISSTFPLSSIGGYDYDSDGDDGKGKKDGDDSKNKKKVGKLEMSSTDSFPFIFSGHPWSLLLLGM